MAMGVGSPQQPVGVLRWRRNARRLTTDQLATLRQSFRAVMGISDDRGYDYFAGIHGLPMPIGCDNAHGTPYFLPWHRAYLYFFERALRDQTPNAALVWWNWAARPGGKAMLPEPYTQEKVDNQPNSLFSGPVSDLAIQQYRQTTGRQVAANTGRSPGTSGAQLPTKAEVEAVLMRSDFLDFSSAMEGLHDRVHMWVGGHMGMIPFAAFDPIFWAHHTMVDRIWRLWQLEHPNASPPAVLLDQALPPFRMTVRQTLDVTALGYDYAVASASTPGGS